MPGLISDAKAKAAHVAIRTAFEALKGQVTSDLTLLATFDDSDSDLNLYPFLAQFPQFREWVGQRMVHGLKERSYTITSKDYELTVGFDRNALDDAKSITKQLVLGGIVDESRRLPLKLIIDAIKNGTTALGYDGQFFFDTDHPTDLDTVTGTQSNYQATAFALTRTNFQTARTRIRSFAGENGRSYGNGFMNTNLLLVIPPELEVAAEDIVNVNNIAVAGGTTNNTLFSAARVVIVPELSTQPTAWYLFDTSGSLKPIIVQQRQSTRLVARDKDTDDNLFWHKEYIFGADLRVGVGYGAWHKAFKGVG